MNIDLPIWILLNKKNRKKFGTNWSIFYWVFVYLLGSAVCLHFYFAKTILAIVTGCVLNDISCLGYCKRFFFVIIRFLCTFLKSRLVWFYVSFWRFYCKQTAEKNKLDCNQNIFMWRLLKLLLQWNICKLQFYEFFFVVIWYKCFSKP